MKTKVNEYPNGVKSLGFKDADGDDVTVGVLPPGEYDFGVAERSETIKVVSGILKAKGETLFAESEKSIVFKKGEQIKFSCTVTVAYVCRYGN